MVNILCFFNFSYGGGEAKLCLYWSAWCPLTVVSDENTMVEGDVIVS